MPDSLVYLNGVDAETGEYLVPPLAEHDIASLARGEGRDAGKTTWLGNLVRRLKEPHLGLPLGVDPAKPAEAGWAAVFHEDEPAETREALAPLVAARGGRELDYANGETRRAWLRRQGVGEGSVLPEKVPYYLLLVGGPQRIPYDFQFLLDVDYAVGRLDLDSPADYRLYAESVIAYEQADEKTNVRSAVFFGSRHAFDPATKMSADLLVAPLAGRAPGSESVAARYGFATRPVIGDEATKAGLSAVFHPGKAAAPAFCFTATHGLGWPKGHDRQVDEQGALICQDWARFGALDSNHYFSAANVGDDARVFGMVTFHFACYGAGTPARDSFAHVPGQAPPEIAEQPFGAKLPKRLLSHPAGSALAVVGHVERAWGYSIVTPSAGPQLLPFTNAIGGILSGLPVGHAVKDFNERYAILSTELSGLLEEIGFGANIPDNELAQAWVERNDAQNYVVLGDPAVHLRDEVLGEEDAT